MRGQGFSSCLVCKDDSGLILNSKFCQKIIETCFNTDEVIFAALFHNLMQFLTIFIYFKFDAMLNITKMCFGCIGRLAQLHQFMTNKIALKDTAIENEDNCGFCYKAYEGNDELLENQVQNDLRAMLLKTQFADVRKV